MTMCSCPISILAVLSKVLDKVEAAQVIDHPETNQQTESGFQFYADDAVIYAPAMTPSRAVEILSAYLYEAHWWLERHCSESK